MEQIPILAPAAVLVLWSLVVLLWVTATRFPAFAKAGITMGEAPPGSRYADVESRLPAKVNWKSHNYTHLMEQPTIFYAMAIALAIAGFGGGLNLTLAWIYVASRVLHSIVQSTFNKVLVRFSLFMIGSIALAVMAINGALQLMG